ncbi:MAG: HAD-IC family P-type ATPase [Microbacteriaceae bacterium]|nr:HAD-IC family P-type ATPase [Microbacteriaceae bacterium]
MPNLQGLSNAEISERVASGQTNLVESKTSRSYPEIFRTNVFTRINGIYLVLFLVVMSTGYFFDGLFGLLIIVNSVVGMIQEVRAKHTLDRLAIIGKAKPTVVREGAEQEIEAEDIVLGDLIKLSVGDQVLVDGTTVSSHALEVDESMLTGEADPVLKAESEKLLSGSFVVSGAGYMEATAVGKDAYAVKLAAEASAFRAPTSQLRSGIDQILKYITWLLIPVGILTIVNQLWFVQGETAFPDALRGMVAALVPMVPEGLVLMTSVAMAVGVIRLGKFNALVQDLPAIEQLARVNVVCADKTGTLTEDGMRLAEIIPLGQFATKDQKSDSMISNIIASAVLSISLIEEKPNASTLAILEGLEDIPADRWEPQSRVPFSSFRKWSSASFNNNGHWIFGAPDVLFFANKDALTAADRIGEQGLRVIALARSKDALSANSKLPTDLEPAAIVVLEQKIRPEAGPTLDFFTKQDVELKVISGDNPKSVAAVVSDLNIPGANEPVDARTLPDSPEELAEIVGQHSIFGRVAPAQKRAMVHALQARGKTVAMTGDGVNDVLALKDADVGVAMGSGSPASRAVARIVLLDNSFATLPHAVGEGRRVIGNIERVANLFLTKTLYSVILALLVGLTAVPFPFLPRHITVIAWFTIGIPAFFLALWPNNERAKDGFVKRILLLAVPGGLVIGITTYVAYLIARHVNGGGIEFQVMNSTTAFLTVNIIAFAVLLKVASPYSPLKVLLVGAMILGTVLVTFTPLNQLFLLDPWHETVLIVSGIAGAIGAAVFLIATKILFGSSRSGQAG